MKSRRKTELFLMSLLFILFIQMKGQHLGLSFDAANKSGLNWKTIDSTYKVIYYLGDAKAVFNNLLGLVTFQNAYQKMMTDLETFLKQNNFDWKRPYIMVSTQVYFDTDGTIDYFLYCYLKNNPKTRLQLPKEKDKEFNRLLNLFIKDYSTNIRINVKFAYQKVFQLNQTK